MIDDTVYETRLTRKFAERKPYQADPVSCAPSSPASSGRSTSREGRQVERGAPLLVLEAMKMSNDVSSSCHGTVARIQVGVGEMVVKGQLLIELD